MFFRFLILLVVVLTCTRAVAQELAGNEISNVIGNKTVTLLTMGFRFPLYYASGGTVSGDGTAVGLSSYFNPKETGRWWVENNQLCQKFPTWYKGKTFCFVLEKSGNNRLRWTRNDGFSGKALISS